ncbi:MAG: ATP-binding protein [Desulfarculaceae bacterium]|nr:ATP-binding protein [Desulfarculaceae bacterium]
MVASSLEIGHVTSISGSKVMGVLLQPQDSGDARAMAASVQIGSLVKLATTGSVAFGLISGLSIPRPAYPLSTNDLKMMEIELLGEAMAGPGGQVRFQRGVSLYPSLGAPILTAGPEDLAELYTKGNDSNVQIGAIRQESSLPAYIATDDIFGKHFALLGNSGTGKSCAITAILRAALNQHREGHVVILDPHDEYAKAFGNAAEVIGPDKLKLPYWLLNSEEIVKALCSQEEALKEVEAPILKEAIVAAKNEHPDNKNLYAKITVDTPVPYSLAAMVGKLKAAMGRLNRPEGSQPYLRIISRVESLQRDRRFAFMFSSVMGQDYMEQILGRILRIPVEGKPVAIIPLSGIPSEIVDVVVSLVCRLIFDFALWSERASAVPILLVCEEAHRYAPRDPSLGFAPTRRAISRIAKEGRKYGVGMGLITQRPSEISEAILSQCNTLFAMRLSNDKDQDFVMAALPESALGLIKALPALRTQEAIVTGEGVNFPVIIRFADLDQAIRPKSNLLRVSEGWRRDPAAGLVAQTVERWRNHGN